MKIVVLCGGISTEREISIISGTQVCLALRKKGHRAILLDVFCGDERIKNAGPDSFPEEYDVEAAAAYARSFDDKLEEIKKTRDWFFGPNVLKLCNASDTVFMALHGSNGEDGKLQATFELLGIPFLFLKQNSAGFLLPVLGTVAISIGLMIAYHRILSRYQRKEGK